MHRILRISDVNGNSPKTHLNFAVSVSLLFSQMTIFPIGPRQLHSPSAHLTYVSSPFSQPKSLMHLTYRLHHFTPLSSACTRSHKMIFSNPIHLPTYPPTYQKQTRKSPASLDRQRTRQDKNPEASMATYHVCISTFHPLDMTLTHLRTGTDMVQMTQRKKNRFFFSPIRSVFERGVLFYFILFYSPL